MAKEYTGTVYIGVVGPETDFGEAWRSIVRITRREGDSHPNFFEGTKGYELRQLHINNFIESGHDFILMLDHDMVFADDTLERLRSHKLPYVSGLYMRRQYRPVAPIWFESDTYWPSKPWVTIPERGKLHPIGASGWGCILIHREVIENTRAILKGEPEVIEDDMDVWPYDLETVFKTLNTVDLANPNSMYQALVTLQRELIPLRGDKIPVGSDIRYPFYAKAAGYQLFGDPDVRPGHILNYPLTPEDFEILSSDFHEKLQKNNDERWQEGHEVWKQALSRFAG